MRHAVLFTEIAHGIHLIFHQSDQGGNDHRRPFQQDRWQLITQGLPASGGH
ncbi:hypothetical protein Barb7_02872 [Bacteroidales bacterium Barb7]|nr:hypothetical protein Barb7_02872 [Bacteroidales bacterium Barb7]